MMKDKAIEPILKLLPKQANYYFCSPNFKRALDVHTLQNYAQKHGLTSLIYPSVEQAKQMAIQKADAKDLILIMGSCFVVAEAI